MKNWIIIIATFITIQACSNDSKDGLIDQWKQEITQTEKEFSDLAVREGIPRAFLTYAAKDAVLKRGNNLIIGWDAINDRFNKQSPADVTLAWVPDFVDVAASGDLGYTYGHYTLTSMDSLGNKVKSTGVFHTVWKRQADGQWRFVWD